VLAQEERNYVELSMSGSTGERSFADIITCIRYWGIHSKPIPYLFTLLDELRGLVIRQHGFSFLFWPLPAHQARPRGRRIHRLPRKDELIEENLNKRKGALGDGQKVSEVRKRMETELEIHTKGEEFHFIKQRERETGGQKEDCPVTNSTFNEIKDYASNIQDGRGGRLSLRNLKRKKGSFYLLCFN
jgi:hypothetical protein